MPWFDEHNSKQSILSRDAFEEHLNGFFITKSFDQDVRNELFVSSEGDQGMMQYSEIQALNAKLYKMIPRFRLTG